MAKRAITLEVFDKMVVAFRQAPENWAFAGKAAGVDPRTAKRAWQRGWPKVAEGLSISEIIDQERLAARAAIRVEAAAKAAAAEKERDDARKQAIQARKQEGQMIGLSRSGAVQALAASTNLAQAALKLAEKVKQRLIHELDMKDENGHPLMLQMPLSQAMHLLSQAATVQRQIVANAHEAMVMERLHLGEPAQIIGIQRAGVDGAVTYEEASIRIRAAQQALEAAKDSNRLELIEGGKTG